jgi:membrane-bound serine protease (ClpP class)
MNSTIMIALMMVSLLGAHWNQQKDGPIPASRQADTLAIIEIVTPIDSLTAKSVKRRFEEARKDGTDAIIIEIDTPGGELDAMLEICRLIKYENTIPTTAWINPEAYSAGAIIALACDDILMVSGGRMGDAAPIAAMPLAGLIELPPAERAKLESPLLTEVVDSARRNGYDEKLVQSFIGVRFSLWEIANESKAQRLFVDANEYQKIFGTLPPLTRGRGETPSTFNPKPAVGESEQRTIEVMQDLRKERVLPTAEESNQWTLIGQLVGEEELLILTAEEAERAGISSGTADDMTTVMRFHGASESKRYTEHWSELFARFLMSWPVRIVLVIVLIIGFFLEAAAPGVGVFGGIALIALGILIGAPMVAGMAEWWEIMLVLASMILIAVELFLLPGTGIVGVLGIIGFFTGLISLLVNGNITSPDGLDQAGGFAAAMIGAMIAGILGAWWLARRSGGSWIFQRMVLDAQSGISPTTNPVKIQGDFEMKGRSARTVTEMRPSGRIEVDGKIHTARSNEGWINQDVTVIIVGEFGGELEIQAHPDDHKEDPEITNEVKQS